MVLEFVLSGLVALVRQDCLIKKAEQLNAILMKGHVDHHPLLLIENGFTVPEDHPTQVVDTPDGKQYLVWDLTGFRLDVPGAPPIGIWEGMRQPKSSTEWQKEVPDYGNHASADPPDDFSWVPELAKACKVDPATQKLKADIRKVDQLPDYANARLMTLTINESANNKTDWLEAIIDDDRSKNPRIFTFQPDYKQVLADRVKFTLTFPNTLTTKLELYSYKEKKVTETITLIGAHVPLEISNLPSEHINYTGGQQHPLEHFDAYKDLFATDPGTCMAPWEPPFISVHPVKCTICTVCGPD